MFASGAKATRYECPSLSESSCLEEDFEICYNFILERRREASRPDRIEVSSNAKFLVCEHALGVPSG